MTLKRVEIFVHGRVQGVFFRYTTKKIAKKLRLKGIVENMEDGSVHIIAEGSKENLIKLIEFARKGPKDAIVTEFKFKFKEPKNEFKHFSSL